MASPVPCAVCPWSRPPNRRRRRAFASTPRSVTLRLGNPRRMTKATLTAALFLKSLGAAGCGDAPATGAATDSTAAAGPPAASAQAPPYDFAHPDTVISLPPSLLEISGLGVLPDGRLAAVFDEEGVLFTLDAESGAILDERSFDGTGDYEGVEWAEGATWVLRSNGTLQ